MRLRFDFEAESEASMIRTSESAPHACNHFRVASSMSMTRRENTLVEIKVRPRKTHHPETGSLTGHNKREIKHD